MDEIKRRTVAATDARSRKICGGYGTCPVGRRRKIVTAALVLTDRAEGHNVTIWADAVVGLHSELD